jgi:hypothetical protein
MCTAAVLPAQETIEALRQRWTVPIAADWKADPDLLRMLVARPQTQPRRPSQFALLDSPPWQSVRIDVEAKRLGGSLIIVYAWKDSSHFNYAHLSVDAPMKQPVHNGIFHVFGGDRVRISSLDGPGSLPTADKWYRIQLNYDAARGEVDVAVDGKLFPSLRGIDLSLGAGKVGLGSFFETAEFRNFRISGKHAAAQ